MKRSAKPSAQRPVQSRRSAGTPKPVSWTVRYVAAKPNARIRPAGCGCGSSGSDT